MAGSPDSNRRPGPAHYLRIDASPAFALVQDVEVANLNGSCARECASGFAALQKLSRGRILLHGTLGTVGSMTYASIDVMSRNHGKTTARLPGVFRQRLPRLVQPIEAVCGTLDSWTRG